YGLTIGDVNDVIEAAIGGNPISTTIEGRARFSINVRYPRDLRDNIDKLKQVLVPLPMKNGGSQSGSGGGMGYVPRSESTPLLAGGDPFVEWQAWKATLAMSGGGNQNGSAPYPTGTMGAGMNGQPMSSGRVMGTAGSNPTSAGNGESSGRGYVPLGQIADIKVVNGPPMIRDENGMLVGYVYVDIDQNIRDVGGYVTEAKETVAKEMAIPSGYFLKWTGQYELMDAMMARMKIVIPIAMILIIILLFLNFRNLTETFIVLASVPFALVGSIWLMYFLGYNYSTATLVGIIALIGLATETGIVMILYLDQAYERRKKAGKVRDLNDIIWAHMEGTVMRVRPKLMTVATTMLGLVPLLWATGSGADVMKRIAAPMIGGLISSTFLTLEIIPVVYTYWRLWQIKREKRGIE
ncbi:MAG: efflux RND transporter permease subunit, partial [Candidatus Zixiibacteriota bacterium]